MAVRKKVVKKVVRKKAVKKKAVKKAKKVYVRPELAPMDEDLTVQKSMTFGDFLEEYPEVAAEGITVNDLRKLDYGTLGGRIKEQEESVERKLRRLQESEEQLQRLRRLQHVLHPKTSFDGWRNTIKIRVLPTAEKREKLAQQRAQREAEAERKRLQKARRQEQANRKKLEKLAKEREKIEAELALVAEPQEENNE